MKDSAGKGDRLSGRRDLLALVEDLSDRECRLQRYTAAPIALADIIGQGPILQTRPQL